MTLKKFLLAILLSLGLNDSKQATGAPETIQSQVKSEFDSLTGWKDDSSGDSPKSYEIQNGELIISTRANSKDRVKVATTRRFGLGKYTWRVFVPELGVGDQASIGAFLYRNDTNEIDFEIGYGAAKLREKLHAKEDDLVCYCTTQGNPYSSGQFLLKRNAWYDVSIQLTKNNANQIKIKWFIDGRPVKELQSKIDAAITFTAHCSVENLAFLGDHLPTQKSSAKFDSFEYTP